MNERVSGSEYVACANMRKCRRRRCRREVLYWHKPVSTMMLTMIPLICSVHGWIPMLEYPKNEVRSSYSSRRFFDLVGLSTALHMKSADGGVDDNVEGMSINGEKEDISSQKQSRRDSRPGDISDTQASSQSSLNSSYETKKKIQKDPEQQSNIFERNKTSNKQKAAVKMKSIDQKKKDQSNIFLIDKSGASEPTQRKKKAVPKSSPGKVQYAQSAIQSLDGSNTNNLNSKKSKRGRGSDKTYSSLLPPIAKSKSEIGNDSDVSMSARFSSWEQFLGDQRIDDNIITTGSTSQKYEGLGSSRGISNSNSTDKSNIAVRPPFSDPNRVDVISSGQQQQQQQQQLLPSIQDLFPPKVLSSTGPLPSSPRNDKVKSAESSLNFTSPLDGVLPVSDLFYRFSEEGDDEEDHDDEELPFSAEQSDSISSDDNKIRIRRNLARKSTEASNTKSVTTNGKGSSGRKKMSRRGMEMLVDGVPINADPPQRSLDLIYNEKAEDWSSTILLNTRDFGPMSHVGSVTKLSNEHKGLFCEHFCHSAIKWDVCPQDLRQVVRSYQSKAKNGFASKQVSDEKVHNDNTSLEISNSEKNNTGRNRSPSLIGSNSTASITRGLTKRSAFQKTHSEPTDHGQEDYFGATGEFAFEIGVSLEELQTGEGGVDGSIFRDVFARAFTSILERAVSAASSASEDFRVEIPNLSLEESDDGYTHVTVEFKIEAEFATDYIDMERRLKKLGAVFTEAIDDGDIALAIAAAAKDEERWPEAVRDRVVEECLFQDDEEAEELGYLEDESYDTQKENVEKEESILYIDDDLILGGGKDGVFYDISSLANSPYGGEIGFRLVDAVVERSRQRQPRVIAIGDVHGCIDELQDLLRQCDYRPGDLVVFLGDLVCKGPDSISVVQMAREIGAIGVRGNHDFEVVRWHQAIKSGVDPPIVRSEHFHIASCLSKADMKWMYSLPWYILSKELESLFVHAGFVSGIRLKKQNPRLMMNMRSILPDGTVTSKYFNNWPWARLWDGPQTVLFGHDADRGLQQYEHAIGLDTGCVYGGRLTACILPEKRLVSVSARREYFKHRRKHYD